MSTGKGNVARTRPQKYQNRSSFKNDLHDKTPKIKMLNSLQIFGVCDRCKEIIEWKIKYKKYKPLTAPKKCVRCELRTVKHAYHVMCSPCGQKENVCAKCCQPGKIIPEPSDIKKSDAEFQDLLKSLPERKRRLYLRLLKQQSEGEILAEFSNEEKIKKLEDLTSKLNIDDGDLDSIEIGDLEEDSEKEDNGLSD